MPRPLSKRRSNSNTRPVVVSLRRSKVIVFNPFLHRKSDNFVAGAVAASFNNFIKFSRELISGAKGQQSFIHSFVLLMPVDIIFAMWHQANIRQGESVMSDLRVIMACSFAGDHLTEIMSMFKPGAQCVLAIWYPGQPQYDFVMIQGDAPISDAVATLVRAQEKQGN